MFGATAAQILLFFLGGINIALSRKKHRIRGFFLIIPIIGIVNGVIVPILIMSKIIFGFRDDPLQYIFITYGILIFFGTLFYFKGKKWRNQFEMQTGDRHLQKWESLLLGIVGVLMMAFSTMIGYSTELIQNQTELENETTLVQDIAGQFVSNLFLTCLVSFVLSQRLRNHSDFNQAKG